MHNSDDTMTRPNIVRADTLDLQDQDNPTAAEHQKPHFQGGLAPHQRSEVHHVIEERTSEEHALADAWNISNSLTGSPDAIDQAQQHHNGEHDPAKNAQQAGQEEGEEADAEADADADADDDMMDRISSSPSIDDGGYIPHSSPPATLSRRTTVWPVRSSSLTPSPRNTPTPTRETFNQSAASPPDSSPFVQTPQHLPLQLRRSDSVAFHLGPRPDSSLSLLDESPRHLPTISVEQANGDFFLSSKHHHKGRYRDSKELEPLLEATEDEAGMHDDVRRSIPERPISDHMSENSVVIHDVDPHKRPIESPFRTHPFKRNIQDNANPHLEQSPSLNSIASVDLKDVLLPMDDPLLDTPPAQTDATDDTDDWESLSSESESLDGSMNDDDTDALFADLEPRFIDSGWGGECLRETEDIDFEFVYALHTFVATVEGQANATKGDTMVLLDDSNSYWWLVRVVKDASIGYLPAEHIETPTERLARLNKHRNIDLSATMLSDNSEKSRNPLKKAMRRRNAKTVQFAAPTYVEASDYDYDTEEEEQPVEPPAATVQAEEVQQNGEPQEEEPAAERRDSQDETVRTSTSSSRLSFDREQAATISANADEPQVSPKLVDKTEAAPLKSRKTRNTDSFLKDDSIETRKITLTPGLLREENAGKSSTSTDSGRNASLENIVAQVQPQQPLSKKDSKKEKEKKKGGMLSGLFKSKKKDKKEKGAVDTGEVSDVEKPSMEIQRESPSRSPLASGRASPTQGSAGMLSPVDSKKQEIETRQPTRGGKLQKTQPSGTSPIREGPQVQEQSAEFVAELQGSEAATEMATAADPDSAAKNDQQHIHTELAAQDKQQNESPLSPITNLLKRDDSKTQKPTKAKKAKARMELDDFDSPSEEEEEEEDVNPFKEQEERAATAESDSDRLSASPVEIIPNTFMHGTESVHIPNPSPSNHHDEPDSDSEAQDAGSLTSSPSLIDAPPQPPEEPSPSDTKTPPSDSDATPTAPRSPDPPAETPTRDLSVDSTTSSSGLTPATSTAASQQSWSDASLRAWLEDGSEVKDMMVLIHDTSGVEPVGAEHPMMAGLWVEERKGVEGMMRELDGLLEGFLGRRGVRLG